MQGLDDLENLGGFRFPELYRRAEAECRLDYASTDDGWSDRQLLRVLERPPLLFLGEDYLGLTVAEVESRYRDAVAPSADGMPPESALLVPIGRTRRGGLYCLDFRAVENPRANSQVPVVLAGPEGEEPHLLAPSLDDFVFVSLLGAARHIDDGALVSAASTLRAIARAHEPFLRSAHSAVLSLIHRRRSPGVGALITDAEFAEIVRRIVGVDAGVRSVDRQGA